jgi:hypothetical protein
MMSLCVSAVLYELHVSQMCLNIKDLDRVAVNLTVNCGIDLGPTACCVAIPGPSRRTFQCFQAYA